jgi:hypothetical protein
MIIPRFTNPGAEESYIRLALNQFRYTGANPELRSLLHPPLEEIINKYKDKKNKEYPTDLEAGLALYRILSPENIGLRAASDEGIWKYLSTEILPDVVFARCGDNENRFWKLKRRIWLKTAWWYIHLSWQGDEEKTRNILQELTTDEIVQLVERVGSGYRTDLNREIMKQLPAYRSKSSHRDIFRILMKLNTARLIATEPSFCDGGTVGYVQRLYSSLAQ